MIGFCQFQSFFAASSIFLFKLALFFSMLKDFLKYYLGIDQLREEVKQLSEEKVAQEDFQEVESDLSTRLSDLESRVTELEPVTVDLTNRERQVLELFLNAESGEYLDVASIAGEINTSRTNAGSIISNMKNKVDFDIKTVENNKKLYRLPEEEKEKILGKK